MKTININFDKIKKIIMIINHKFKSFKSSYPRKNYPIEFSVEYGSLEKSLSFKNEKKLIPIYTIEDDSDFEEFGLLDDEENYLAMSDDD